MRRILAGGAAAFGLAAGVLAVEVQLARTRPKLPERPPFDLDRTVGEGRPGRARLHLWLGDSTAAGVGADEPDGALPVRVAVATSAMAVAPVELRVFAISGATVADVVDEQVDEAVAAVRAAPPAQEVTVFISAGANDVVHLTSAGTVAEGYRRIVDAIPDRAALVVLGVPDMGAPTRFDQPLRAIAAFRGRQLADVIRDVADDRRSTAYVDIAGETGPPIRRDPERYLAADAFHPSSAGYGLWAEAVIEATTPGPT